MQMMYTNYVNFDEYTNNFKIAIFIFCNIFEAFILLKQTRIIDFKIM